MKRWLISGLFFSSLAYANPAQVVIVRHAEKLSSGVEVSPQGCERAFLLTQFFSTNSVVNKYGSPVAFYAARPKHADSSIRSEQTLAPSASQSGLNILDPYVRDQYQPVVDEISSTHAYDGKTVVMAWEHDSIPVLAQTFGVKLNSSTKSWPDMVFDEAWVIDFTGKKNPSLTIIPESVLPGDNPLGGKDWQNGPTPGEGNPVPSNIVQECGNNDALNVLTNALVTPPFPQ